MLVSMSEQALLLSRHGRHKTGKRMKDILSGPSEKRNSQNKMRKKGRFAKGTDQGAARRHHLFSLD